MLPLSKIKPQISVNFTIKKLVEVLIGLQQHRHVCYLLTAAVRLYVTNDINKHLEIKITLPNVKYAKNMIMQRTEFRYTKKSNQAIKIKALKQTKKEKDSLAGNQHGILFITEQYVGAVENSGKASYRVFCV
jgi:hypothetical protein